MMRTLILSTKVHRRAEYGRTYGRDFWMSHYRKLRSMFPTFPLSVKYKRKGREVMEYFKTLKKEGAQLPSRERFYVQMKHICKHRRPLCAQCGRKRRVHSRSLPNHVELMSRFDDISLEGATRAYNEEIRRYYKDDKTKNTIGRFCMWYWRRCFRKTRTKSSGVIDGSSEKYPSRQTEKRIVTL